MGVEDIENMIDNGLVLPDVVAANNQYINVFDSNGLAALHYACLDDNPGKITAAQARLLLSYGADIEAPDETSGQRPLHHAASYGDTELVRFLLESGAEVNSTAFGSATPLSFAILGLRYDNAAVLRNYGGKTETGMATAAECGDILRVIEIATSHPQAIHSVDEEHFDRVQGNLPLHYASRGPDVRLNSRIDRAASPRFPSRDAIVDKQFQVVDFLCRNDADVHARNENGVTPIFYAASEGYHEIVDLLLSFGADVNSLTAAGGTPVLVASRLGHVDVVRLLLERGADPTIESTEGNTPLKVAREGGHSEVVVLLSQHGAVR